ncbi:hypothetical protein DFS33DRAFT_1383129 [Desarmillaria ectypa]|nr:hypothetical protein DFS33DRAFT_1383129 [Desarmillaria ectypa]
MAFHLPMLSPHGPLNIHNLIRSVNPKPKPVREIQRTTSATNTAKVAKHTAPSTDPTRRASSQRKESQVENAQAALHRRQLRARLNRKLPAKNPRFLPGKDPVPSEILKPTNNLEACIASLNSNHVFIFAAHRNQQAFDRNSKRKAVAKRNAQIDEHDRKAEELRHEKWVNAETAELKVNLTEANEHHSRIEQGSQPNEVQGTARSQESSLGAVGNNAPDVDYIALFSETMEATLKLRREYQGIIAPERDDSDASRWAETQFHLLQSQALVRGGSPIAALHVQYKLKWGFLFQAVSQSEPTMLVLSRGTKLCTFPWPCLMFVTTVEDLTHERVRKFYLNPARPFANEKNHIDVLNEELRKWHPDNFSRFLDLVSQGHRESIQKGAEIVVKAIVDLLQE